MLNCIIYVLVGKETNRSGEFLGNIGEVRLNIWVMGPERWIYWNSRETKIGRTCSDRIYTRWRISPKPIGLGARPTEKRHRWPWRAYMWHGKLRSRRFAFDGSWGRANCDGVQRRCLYGAMCFCLAAVKIPSMITIQISKVERKLKREIWKLLTGSGHLAVVGA